jgi:hypothetical protein
LKSHREITASVTPATYFKRSYRNCPDRNLTFLASLGMGLLFSRKTERKSDLQLERLVYWGRHPGDPAQVSAVWWLLAFLLLAACVMLNYVWR